MPMPWENESDIGVGLMPPPDDDSWQNRNTIL
jgi:hypothetical protein